MRVTRSQVMGSLRQVLREISAASDIELRERDERKDAMLKQIAYVIHEHHMAFLQARKMRRTT